MTDEHALLKERDRGHHAKQVLDNVVFRDAWARMDANLVAAMSSPETPDEGVLEARRGLVILRRLKSEIETEMQTGQMAAIQLDES